MSTLFHELNCQFQQNFNQTIEIIIHYIDIPVNTIRIKMRISHKKISFLCFQIKKNTDNAFLFFNGQTADINGNIPLTGGSGVAVRPANVSDYYKGIPTIDVLSTPELLNIIGD
mgnify:CR=1 FL=1